MTKHRNSLRLFAKLSNDVETAHFLKKEGITGFDDGANRNYQNLKE